MVRGFDSECLGGAGGPGKKLWPPFFSHTLLSDLDTLPPTPTVMLLQGGVCVWCKASVWATQLGGASVATRAAALLVNARAVSRLGASMPVMAASARVTDGR
jgi:hypothetical protein